MIAGLALALVFMSVRPASALSFTVNSTADREEVNQGDGICETATVGECTLRAAIMEANASPGTDSISFHIPGAGPHTITPSHGSNFIFLCDPASPRLDCVTSINLNDISNDSST